MNKDKLLTPQRKEIRDKIRNKTKWTIEQVVENIEFSGEELVNIINEINHIPNKKLTQTELKVYGSAWGTCVALLETLDEIYSWKETANKNVEDLAPDEDFVLGEDPERIVHLYRDCPNNKK